MLELLTRVLLWASVGILIWYILVRIIPSKYLTWFGGFILITLLALSYAAPNDGTISIIWQILSFPLTPLGAVIILLGSALSEGLKKIRANPVAIALAILLFSSIPITAQWLVSQAEGSIRDVYEERAELCGEVCRIDQIPTAGLTQARTIVVMGESRDIDDALNLIASQGGDVSTNTPLLPRLIYAADLYQRTRVQSGVSPLVIVTAGGSSDSEADQNRRNIIRNILINNGVASEDIRIEDTGINIKNTAERVEDILEDSGAIGSSDSRREEGATRNDPRIVLVTPAILMSRAALTFENRNLQVIARPIDFYTAGFNQERPLTGLSDILPSVEALQLTTRYWEELRTSLYYFLRGWLPSFNFGWNSNIEI
jgi:uncharacterized SAM-binding protein YcdF (DUF218 family)